MVTPEQADKLINKLREHGQGIGTAARAGNKTAAKVVAMYEFWRRCPGDGMAYALCEDALDAWLAARAALAKAEAQP